jgi:hypothetical protein
MQASQEEPPDPLPITIRLARPEEDRAVEEV